VRALTVALALGGLLLLAPASAPNPAAAVGPLPDCRLADVLTVPRGYDDWSTTLVDWILSVGPDYKPPDLVNVRDAGLGGSGYVRKVAFDDLKAMASAAKANGSRLSSVSAYRSYKQQVDLFGGYAKGDGYDDAVTYSARPGHSEHQLGLTIDFGSYGSTGLDSKWESTRAGAWMAKHAWEYGWLMSYPKGKQDLVCYRYEPWHYRYVGRDLAAKIHASGVTVREYLWSHFTLVDPVTGAPLPTPTAVPTATPAASAVPSAGPAVSQPTATPAPGTSTGSPAAPGGPSTAPPDTSNTGQSLGPAVIGIGLLLAATTAAGLAWLGLRRRRSGS